MSAKRALKRGIEAKFFVAELQRCFAAVSEADEAAL